MVMHGRLGMTGHITLTAKRVSFEPTSFSRTLGSDSWTMDVASLHRADLVLETLVLEGDSGQRRVTGLGAVIVQERLAALRNDVEQAGYQADERVLVHALASVQVNDLLHAVGVLTLTTRRIRFQPNRIDRGFWPALAFEEKTKDIESFAFTGLRLGLEVRTASRTARFLGAAVPALYAGLQCLSEAAAGPPSLKDIDFDLWPAALCRGPVMHPGVLLRTATRLLFLATGLVDSMLGLQRLSNFPIESITSVTVRRRLEPRIDVNVGESRATFAVAEGKQCHERLVAWLLSTAPGPMLVTDAYDRKNRPEALAQVTAHLDPWRAVHTLPEGPLLFSPAVGLSEDSQATVGCLLVVEDAMLWLPGRTPDPRRPPILLPLSHEQWVWPDALNEVATDRSGQRYRWIIKGDEPFCRGLLDQVRRIKEQIALNWVPPESPAVTTGFNRRDSFRVQVLENCPPPLTVHLPVLDTFQAIDCTFVEVSLGGCAIRTSTMLGIGTRVRIDLTEPERVRTVTAVVEHERQRPWGWLTGLAFEEPDTDFQSSLRDLWTALQQLHIRRMRGEENPQWLLPWWARSFDATET